MQIANDPLNYQALALEEAETELRILVRDNFYKRTSRAITDSKAKEIINKALGKIKIPSLKIEAKQSLVSFYLRQRREINRINGKNLLVLLSLIKLTQKDNGYAKNVSISRAKAVVKDAMQNYNATHGTYYDTAKLYGVPLQKFSKDYMNENVKPVLTDMAKQFPLDPEDISGRNSLRNKAEMAVRYQSHLDSIEDLRTKGHKLVIASVHADCSERCRKYQGRVYSLDGTSGTTADGRKFVPLEEATDVYYTTKAGKRYKNGLLGFNCRHYLVPYKDGFRFSKPNPKVEEREYKITQKQRYLERQVRHWRTEAITNNGIFPEYATIARNTAIKYNKEYIKFSKDNGRAYYPSRTKLL